MVKPAYYCSNCKGYYTAAACHCWMARRRIFICGCITWDFQLLMSALLS